jgi:two-component system sensor histidine kinase QseC
MRSIRTFLVVVIVSVVCLSNFLAALQGYRDSLNAADQIEQQQLLEKFSALNVLVENQVDIPADLFNENTLFKIWSQGQLLAASNDATQELFNNREQGFHLKSYEANQWLLYGVEDSDTDLYIAVATKYRVYSSLTEEVLILAILPIIWILPVIGILIWVIVNVGTKPIKQLAVKLSFREVNDFSSLKSDRYTSELQPIISSLNGLFNRLSDAFERERRFSADAAHELRTPLAALKVNLHNLSKEQKDNEIWRALKRTADRMEHSIEQLLSLHRVALDADSNEMVVCELRRVTQDVIAEVYDRLMIKRQNIELIGEEAAISIKGNVSSMAILLRNLIDNASKYTPDQGTIRVTVSMNQGHASVLVEDSGPGIAEDEYARVLERFYRVGGDRNNSSVIGSGLGLSIVADIVRIHQGQIYLSNSPDLGGLAVKVTFPSVSGVLNNEHV